MAIPEIESHNLGSNVEKVEEITSWTRYSPEVAMLAKKPRKILEN